MPASETDYLTHEHNFLSRSHDESARRTLWVVGLTAVMMVGEIIAGMVYGSMALLADGFHMATHAGALAVAAGAYAYAKRHAANFVTQLRNNSAGQLRSHPIGPGDCCFILRRHGLNQLVGR